MDGDAFWIRRAAELAVRGRLRVEPNPVVGCVLVKRGRAVGEGWHARWGKAHAEATALKEAGEKARGATAFVTLEPCAHEGKTPSCTAALVKAGVKRVVYAAADPNPETAGEGPRELREAGIEVEKVRTPAVIRRQLEPYRAHLERRRPWVIAKWAMTLDGRIATRTSVSRWITGERARRWVHRELRSTVDAVVVGAGTIRADDPELSNRSGRGTTPLRVVVCGRRRLPSRARLLTDGGPTLLAAPERFRGPPDVETLTCGRTGRVDPRRMMRLLYKRGLRRVLVEGGAGLLGALFDRGLVDQVAAFTAPRIVGGMAAMAPVGGRGRARMEDAIELTDIAHGAFGDDRLIEGLVAAEKAPPSRTSRR